MEAEKEEVMVEEPETLPEDEKQEVAEPVEENTEEFAESGADEEEVDEASPTNTVTEESTEEDFANKFKKKQTKEENAEWAKKRRAEQESKKQTEDAEHKGYIKGLIESVGGKNPYTGDAIETQEDIDEYLLMKKINDAGDDPIVDYHKYLKSAKKEVVETKAKEFDYKADKELFEEKHPDIELNTLLGDKEFNDFAEGLVGIVPLHTIFDKYISSKNEVDKRVRKLVREEMSKKISSTGSLKKPQETEVRVGISSMSKKDFAEMVEKAKRGELRRN